MKTKKTSEAKEICTFNGGIPSLSKSDVGLKLQVFLINSLGNHCQIVKRD